MLGWGSIGQRVCREVSGNADPENFLPGVHHIRQCISRTDVEYKQGRRAGRVPPPRYRRRLNTSQPQPAKQDKLDCMYNAGLRGQSDARRGRNTAYVCRWGPKMWACVCGCGPKMWACLCGCGPKMWACVCRWDPKMCAHIRVPMWSKDVSMCVRLWSKDVSMCVQMKSKDVSMCVRSWFKDVSMCVHMWP